MQHIRHDVGIPSNVEHAPYRDERRNRKRALLVGLIGLVDHILHTIV